MLASFGEEGPKSLCVPGLFFRLRTILTRRQPTGSIAGQVPSVPCGPGPASLRAVARDPEMVEGTACDCHSSPLPS